MSHNPWDLIFKTYQIDQHDFSQSPFLITAEQIKRAVQNFTKTTEKEPRILCKHDTRESRPDIFVQNNLFILPVKNGIYNIIQGEGYIDIPDIQSPAQSYTSNLGFELETSKIGNSEMQHLDFAYASSLIRTFLNDNSLVLTIRGRKYTPAFSFVAGQNQHLIHTESVQTEVDAGYEGKNQVVLLEAKNTGNKNTIIRQLYYPFRQWQTHTNKKVSLLFFEKNRTDYNLWEFGFADPNDYNSIALIKSAKFNII